MGFEAGSKFWSAAGGWQEFSFAVNGEENACVFRVSPSNIYDPAALATPVSRQPLTVQIQNEIQSENIDRWTTEI